VASYQWRRKWRKLIAMSMAYQRRNGGISASAGVSLESMANENESVAYNVSQWLNNQ
jgi:hypothetical protein